MRRIARPVTDRGVSRFAAPVVVQPGVVQLVVPGGRTEVPDHRLAPARQQREADQLVHRPGADVGGGHVADVGEVEGQQAPRSERSSCALAAPVAAAQPVQVHPLFPVDGVGPVGPNRHSLHPTSSMVFNINYACSVTLTRSS